MEDGYCTINVKRPEIVKLKKFSIDPVPSKKLPTNRKNSLRNQRTPLIRSEIKTVPVQEPLSVKKLKRPEILLPLKLFLKQQDSDVFEKRTAISIYERHNIKTADLCKRLYVEHPSNEVNTVTDIDGCFFNIIENRPINLHVPIYKSYKSMLSDYFRARFDIGNINDRILNIELNQRRELATHDLSIQRFTNQARSFDKFISEDYHRSMLLLTKCELLENEVDSKILELQNLATQRFSNISRIIGLDYKYSQQQKYGRFLYYLSPPTWRLKNREFARSIEIETKGFDFGDSSEEDTFTIIFEKLRKICYGTPIKPVLYFTKPDQLIEVFNAMENQQLHYFSHVTHLTPFKHILRDELKTLREIMIQDSATVRNYITKIEKVLAVSEEKSSLLQAKFYKILNGMFYDSVGSIDVLKLTLHLEFCFEKVLRDKPTNLDIVTMARALENFYLEYSYRLDAIQNGSVRRAMAKCEQNERQKYIRAKCAANELRLFNRLEKQLYRAYGLNYSNRYKPQFFERKPKMTNNVQPCTHEEKSNVTLTAAEIEYLKLFTDWTEHDDPARYFQVSPRGEKS
ncbi:unnamed protein product [Leptidea sinapis]|uniref:Uncharacterized protein n=1 Tax=Leptidea sinapis TaxID=189913 RepID=A0A5E4PZS4_9NEOP|nr:unnamed protein product [Leptidea sinapis]